MNPDQIAQYKQYLASEGYSPDQADQYIQYLQSQSDEGDSSLPTNNESESSILNVGKSIGGGALNAAARVLGYPAGMARVLGAQAISGINKLTGQGEYVVTDDDVKDALVGQAPSWGELSKRMGVTEGPSVDIPYVGNISTKDVTDFGMDVALDPFMWATAGQSGVMKKLAGIQDSGRFMNPTAAQSLTQKTLEGTPDVLSVSNKFKSGGKKLHGSAFKEIDYRLQKDGAAPISSLLWNEGIDGSMGQIERKASSLTDDLYRQSMDIAKKGDELGAMGSPEKASQGALNYLKTLLQRSRYTDPERVSKLKDFVDRGFIPDEQIAKQLNQKYANEVDEYLPKLRTYVKEKRAYRNAVGLAGADDAQPVLAGMTDDLQRVSLKPELIEINGPNTKNMTPEVVTPDMRDSQIGFDIGNDVNLSPKLRKYTLLFPRSRRPQPKMIGRSPVVAPYSIPIDRNLPPVQSGEGFVGHSRNASQAATESAKQKLVNAFNKSRAQRQQRLFDAEGQWSNKRFTDALSREGEQMNILGTELTPRRNIWELFPMMKAQEGQTKLILPPQKPTRPVLQQAPVKPMNVMELITTKRELRKKLPDSAFSANGYLSDEGQQVAKSLASGYQEEAVNALNRVEGGLGDQMDSINQRLQTLIEAQHPIELEVRKELRKQPISSVDGALSGAVAINPGNVPILAAKKGADVLKTTWFKTKGGRTLHSVGDFQPLMLPIDQTINNPLLRNMFLQTQENKTESPWVNMTPNN